MAIAFKPPTDPRQALLWARTHPVFARTHPQWFAQMQARAKAPPGPKAPPGQYVWGRDPMGEPLYAPRSGAVRAPAGSVAPKGSLIPRAEGVPRDDIPGGRAAPGGRPPRRPPATPGAPGAAPAGAPQAPGALGYGPGYEYLNSPTQEQLDAEARAAAELAYGPKVRENLAQQRASLQQEQNIKDWYKQYQEQVEEYAEETEDLYKKAGKATKKEGKGAFKEYAREFKGRNVGEAAEAATRGIGGGGVQGISGENLQAGLRAMAQARRSSSEFGGMLRQQGATQAKGYLDLAGVAAASQPYYLAQEAQNRRGMLAQQSDLLGQQGQFEVTQRADLRKRERDWLLEQVAFGLKEQEAKDQAAAAVAKARRDEAEARRKDELARRGQDITIRGQDITARGQDISATTQRRGQDITGTGSGETPNTTRPETKEVTVRDQAVRNSLNTLIQSIAYARSQGWSDAQTRRHLQSTRGGSYDPKTKKRIPFYPWQVSAAFQIVNSGGSLSPAGARQIGTLGYNVPVTGWQVPRYRRTGRAVAGGPSGTVEVG